MNTQFCQNCLKLKHDKSFVCQRRHRKVCWRVCSQVNSPAWSQTASKFKQCQTYEEVQAQFKGITQEEQQSRNIASAFAQLSKLYIKQKPFHYKKTFPPLPLILDLEIAAEHIFKNGQMTADDALAIAYATVKLNRAPTRSRVFAMLFNFLAQPSSIKQLSCTHLANMFWILANINHFEQQEYLLQLLSSACLKKCIFQIEQFKNKSLWKPQEICTVCRSCAKLGYLNEELLFCLSREMMNSWVEDDIHQLGGWWAATVSIILWAYQQLEWYDEVAVQFLVDKFVQLSKSFRSFRGFELGITVWALGKLNHFSYSMMPALCIALARNNPKLDLDGQAISNIMLGLALLRIKETWLLNKLCKQLKIILYNKKFVTDQSFANITYALAMLQHPGKYNILRIIRLFIIDRLPRIKAVQPIVTVAWSLTVLDSISFEEYLLMVERIREIVEDDKKNKSAYKVPVISQEDICQLYQSYLVHTQQVEKDDLNESIDYWIMAEIKPKSQAISKSYFDSNEEIHVYDRLQECFAGLGIKFQTNVYLQESGYVVDAAKVNGQDVVIECLVVEYFTRGGGVKGDDTKQLLGNEVLKYRYLKGLGMKVIIIPEFEYGFRSHETVEQLQQIIFRRLEEQGVY